MDNRLQIFEAHRPLLFSIAYRMLGSVMEAEDAVQEGYLRYMATEATTIKAPKAFLCTVVTRLCLDQLKSARVRREHYVGPWLPEPLATEAAPDELLARHESIATAFLVLLESLSPVERAVFLLREVFDYSYRDIAAMVEKSEANCRQLYSRAKQHLRAHAPKPMTPPPEHRQVVEQFIAALGQGDAARLTALLAEDAVLISDGGGKVAAATRPLAGRATILRFLLGIRGKQPPGVTVEVREFNSAQAMVVRIDGKLSSIFQFHVVAGQIHAFHIIRNPEKLRHLTAPE
ncbi:MAG: RNA polymerase sigma-70 factor [Caldilineaceae bacterium]